MSRNRILIDLERETADKLLENLSENTSYRNRPMCFFINALAREPIQSAAAPQAHDNENEQRNKKNSDRSKTTAGAAERVKM